MKLNYDYIICGGGASGLSLAFELSKDIDFKTKKILIIDPEYPKKNNDRTWCFWEDNDDKNWDDSIFHKWSNVWFKSDSFEKNISLLPLSYKMLKSKQFYEHIYKTIDKNQNIDTLNEKVIESRDFENYCEVKTESNVYKTKKVFNSILNWNSIYKKNKYPLLIQHFEGWFIKTKKDFFNPNEATFMDFTIEQNSKTKFIYTLPFSKNEALIEYTLFSKNVLEKKFYEIFLTDYLKKIGIDDYSIISKESGKIPMTGYPFHKNNTRNILNIGSAGGWSKPSTGYTFKNIERKTKTLVNFLKTNSDLRKFHKTSRFRYYDIIFLDVLFNNNHLGKKLFTEMFKNNKPKTIFKFLDEKSNIYEELSIMANFSVGIFIKTIFQRIFKL